MLHILNQQRKGGARRVDSFAPVAGIGNHSGQWGFTLKMGGSSDKGHPFLEK